ncbi:MAG TPA: diguanylate cyclase [Candidatus Acidoferrum sp.]
MSEGTQRRLVFLFLVAAILLPRAFAEEQRNDFPDHPRFTIQRLGEEFGLEAVTVTAMGQDAQGFLWIATQTGLYRYDGARAMKMPEVESITGHYIVDMLIAPDGSPWFAGNHGIAHFRNGQFEQLAIPTSAMPLATGNQLFAVDSKGTVFVLLFKQGVLRIDPANPTATKLIETASGLQENPAGIIRGADDTIWFTYNAHLAHILAGTTTIEIDSQMNLPKERIVALLFDGKQTLWLRTASRLAKLDPQLHKMAFEDAVIGSANEEEGKPSTDQQGRLLVPSSMGLYWQQGRRWATITDKQGISSNDIECALEDREGTLWVAGSGTGLDRLPGVHEWEAWTTAEGLPDNATWSTLRDRSGRLWVSTSRGIGVWNGKARRWEKIPSLAPYAKREIRQIQLAGDGAIWGLSGTGTIVRIDPARFETKLHPTYHGRAFVTIVAAPDGSIWATTRSHIVRFSAKNGWSEPVESPFPADGSGDVEYLAFSPNGVLWASGPGKLHRYDRRNWRTYTTQDGLQGQTLTSLVPLSDSEVWIAYDDVVSISHLLLDATGNPRMENHKWDFSILGHDAKNRIWFNGTDGIHILSADGSMLRKSHADGLLWDDVSPWTGMREESDGSYMIATSRGLARYHPTELTQAEILPHVSFTSVTLGSVERQLTDVPEVQASDGTLTVQFTPLILDNPDRISCRYQLQGLEKRPAVTQLREVHYGALPAGNYEFWVQCQAVDSKTQSARATFRFRVLPKLWQTWWAQFLGALAGLMAIWLFVSLRTRTESRRRRELEQAVAQRSAELLQKNRELEEISLTDPLTMTRNRRYFYETISTDIAQALRSHLKTINPDVAAGPKHELIFILVDIDRFKRVNDEFGHAAGDRLLQEVAKRIASVMRRSDDLVRWGGEEFLLVCRTTDRDNAGMLCNRVLEAIRELPFDVGNGVQVHKTCSIGWAPFPWLLDDVGLLSIDNVIELADKGLYLAKREGRNRSFGMVPAANLSDREAEITMDRLRDCPPELVQIV